MVFPVVMYGCESWTIKKAECGRIYAFELWCWRRLLRVPWTARRSNQSILKEIRPECSLEGLMLKLKLQYCGPLMQRTDSFEKPLLLGKIECRRRGNREWDGWMESPTRCAWVWDNSGVGDGQGVLACYNSWGHKELDTTEQLNWTKTLSTIWSLNTVVKSVNTWVRQIWTVSPSRNVALGKSIKIYNPLFFSSSKLE